MIAKNIYEDDYFNIKEHLNHSLLCLWQEDPAGFWYAWMNGIKHKETPSMTWGKHVHCFILTPEIFCKKFMITNDMKNPKSIQAENFLKVLRQIHIAFEDKQYLVKAYKDNYSCRSLSEKEIEQRAIELYEKNKDYVQALQ